MILKIKLPSISTGLVSNLIGLLGLVLIVVAVGGLTNDWWWSILTAGTFSVGIAVMLGLEANTETTKIPGGD